MSQQDPDTSNNRVNFVGAAAGYGKRGLSVGLHTLGDFQKFLLRGNVVDLAVGVVIGAAFNSVVQGIVKDFITPLIGLLIGTGNFATYSYSPVIWGRTETFLVGDFINLFISFILTAAVVYFFVVKPINMLEDRYHSLVPAKPAEPVTRDCPFCLSSVPIKATRCAYCTSELPALDKPASIPHHH